MGFIYRVLLKLLGMLTAAGSQGYVVLLAKLYLGYVCTGLKVRLCCVYARHHRKGQPHSCSKYRYLPLCPNMDNNLNSWII